MAKGIYYIENTVDERMLRTSGFFETEEEAREALKECSNWFCPKGTGTIYFQEFGLGKQRVEIFAKHWN